MTAVGCSPKVVEGHGVLAPSTASVAELGGAPAAHPFALANDGSAAVQRTLLASDDDPSLHIVVRDFGVAPGRPTFPIAVGSPGVLEVLGQGGTVVIDKQAQTFKGPGWVALSAQTSFSLVNPSAQPMYVRVYTFEAKP
jgi:hypothetical protein